jgi:hypothetical protein
MNDILTRLLKRQALSYVNYDILQSIAFRSEIYEREFNVFTITYSLKETFLRN